MAQEPSCSAVCGILPDQGSNPCPLHWQVDSQPLRHQGSPQMAFLFVLLPSRVLGLFNQWKLISGPTRNSGKTSLGLVLQHEGAKTSNRCPCSLLEVGQAGPLSGVRVGVDQWVRPEGWGLGGLPTPLVVLCAGCWGRTLLLLLTPQKWQLVCDLFLSYCS